MSISDLLVRLKQEKVTPVTPSNLKGLPLEAPSLLKVTPVTPVTPQKTIVCKISENEAQETTLDRESFEERAAIMEHEGGLSREQAVVEKCNQCRHFNKFGNCLMPQEAGLTTRFELIRAPGEACQVFELKPAPY